MRLDYAAIGPEAAKALAGVNAALLRARDWISVSSISFPACVTD